MMLFIRHSPQDKTIVMERVVTHGEGRAEGVTIRGQYEGVFGDDAILYFDGRDGYMSLYLCKNS